MKIATYSAVILCCLVACRNQPLDQSVWRMNLKSRVYTDPVIDGSRFFVFSQVGEAVAAEIRTGKRIWETRLSGPILGTPAISHQAIFLATQNGDVYSINKENGELLWRNHHQDVFIAPLTLYERMVLVPSESGTLYAFNTKDGGKLWQISNEKKFNARAIVLENSIFVGSWERHVLSLKPDGTIRWKFKAAEIITEEPILWRNLVIVAAYDRFVYALDAQTGRQIWRHAADRPSNVVRLNDQIVFASGKNLLFLEAQSGRLIRTLKIGKTIDRLYTDQARLYMLSDDVYTVNPANAKVSRLFQAEDSIFKLSFASGMIIAVDSLYSIYGYAREQER
jgi:outer membrane protein assembly factor BamB